MASKREKKLTDKRELAMQNMMQDKEKETKKERMASLVVDQMKTQK